MNKPAITAITLLLLGAVASAAPPKGEKTVNNEVGTAQDQLTLDLTRLSAGSGAVFVPSLSRPELEPSVRVFLGDQVVARGSTGRRLPLAPGRYRVVIGNGPPAWRASRDIVIAAGRTTVADRFVGALRVNAVSEVDGQPVTITYSLVSGDGERVYGPEDTTDDKGYDKTRTWLLKPGTYRLVPGSDPKTLRGASVVHIAPDQRARVRFLVDTVGDVMGLEPDDEPAPERRQDMRVDWVVGGSLAFGQADRQIGSFSGINARLEIFTDFGMAYDVANHLLKLQLQLAQSWVAVGAEYGRGLPFQKLDDEVRLELGYTYRIGRIFGPYVRATANTSILPTSLFPEQDYTVITREPDGSETTAEGLGFEKSC